jgi:cytochrome P450
MWPHSLYLMRHPDAIQHILRDQAQRYRKGRLFKPLASIQGQGLLTSEGRFWRQQRRLIQPVFRQRHVDGFYDVVIQEVQSLVDGWRQRAQSGTPIHVTAWLHRLAFRVMGQAILGLHTAKLDPIARQIESIASPLIQHLAADRARRVSWPTRLARNFRRALRAYHDIAQHIVEVRRQTMSHDHAVDRDLLSRLIRAYQAETGRVPQPLRDEILTFIGAGVETTAAALSWSCYLLARFPDVTRRLQAEIDECLAGRVPLLDDLASLPYSRMILEESMRLYPPSAVLPRQANATDDIGGYTVPQHALVMISPYVTHRHADFWPDPDRFDPDRFSTERVTRRHPFAYFPFGAGPRVCIGRPFALLEMQLTLIMMAQAYTPQLLPDRPVEPALGVTLHPRGGLWMTMRTRD